MLWLGSALSACSLMPGYQRPASPVAQNWQGLAQGIEDYPLAEIGWHEFFLDTRLQQLIAQTLDNNRDLRVAALNIERARAQYQVQRSNLFPTINAIMSSTAQQTSGNVAAVGVSQQAAGVSHSYRATVGFSAYELDVFGRIRSLNEQALQTFFATEEARRSTQISLVAEVATAWATLAADQARLKVAQETLQSQQQTYELSKRSFELGVSSALALRQIQTSVDSARVDVATYKSQVTLDRNALDLLAGKPVADELLPLAGSHDQPVSRYQVPANLNSEVLQQRPDVLQAEHALQAANANIGAARAAFFPLVSLTSSFGSASTELSGLFGPGSRVWSFAPSINVPIFNAGRNRANLEVAKIDRDILLAQYEQSIQIAFREVADVLAVRQNLGEQIEAQQSLLQASTEAFELSDARFRNGVDSYLTVLDSQRTMYIAQQNLISLQLADAANQFSLYKVLGGGWKE
ncbi:efflux transporter outer membrane subunit [Methylobacillus arboreus]|nr:efflux transporter outer membrane subunit [Methylobacillus arboreus]